MECHILNLKIHSWRFRVVVALIIIIGVTFVIMSCSNNHSSESVLDGNWVRVDTCNSDYPHILTFDKDGEYYDSDTESEIWNYQFIEPDSLILYHHVFYEERYKILNLKEDTLIIKLSESLFHTEEMGKKIEANICDSRPIYKYIRINKTIK